MYSSHLHSLPPRPRHHHKSRFVGHRLQKHPIFGAYTEAFAGLTPEVDEGRNEVYLIPRGNPYNGSRKDLFLTTIAEEDGGTGIAKRFW